MFFAFLAWKTASGKVMHVRRILIPIACLPLCVFAQGAPSKCSEGNGWAKIGNVSVEDLGNVSYPLKGWVGFTNTGEPVAGMTIECFDAAGKSLLATRQTDDAGVFSFAEFKPGTYFLKATKTLASGQIRAGGIVHVKKNSQGIPCLVAEAEGLPTASNIAQRIKIAEPTGGTLSCGLSDEITPTPVGEPEPRIESLRKSNDNSLCLRIGGRPVYPPLARAARIQGKVLLRAVIDKHGVVKELTAVEGHPMLIPAAMESVKSWKYKPYYKDGKPVEVETTITVNFTLAKPEATDDKPPPTNH